VDIGTAVGKPFSNIKNLVILIILQIVPLVNILTVPGYMIRVANKTMNNDNSMPGFDNIGELIVDSLKYLVISVVYMIPAMIVIGMALGSVIMSIVNASLVVGTPAEAEAMVLTAITEGMATMAGLILLGVILSVLAAILIVSGIMNYAKTKQFGKAFAVVENLKNFFTGSFIVAIIVAIVISIVTGIIMGLLMLIPIIGFILALAIVVAANVVQISILAEGYPSGAPVQSGAPAQGP